ncbi:hypothetical protein ACFOQM_06135 [Paenibacillus sp. GCM10012307]|uniref:Uncharacterized protein n=1 Tax=Paenibacillus roseus TaxID=2798579 RepID=A0A934J5R8_9BACL|nr:hypothetical protein [Paenibacillus roseus]MBJ6360877.1 hypothetical protein [Paenibacillus roseus]
MSNKFMRIITLALTIFTFVIIATGFMADLEKRKLNQLYKQQIEQQATQWQELIAEYSHSIHRQQELTDLLRERLTAPVQN